MDRLFSSFMNLRKFIHLKSIVIDTFNQENLEQILDQLAVVPKLHSLIILSSHVRCTHQIYQQIFRLPALKYCKLPLKKGEDRVLIPFSTNAFSPIEHLVIGDELNVAELNCFLSYAIQLHHLSCCSRIYHHENEIILYPCRLNHLTHISFKNLCLNFNQFELIIKNFFYQVEVLHISMQIYGNN